MNRFKKYKLKDLIIIKNGKDYKSYDKGNIPVYGTGGIITYIDSYAYDGESILLPRKGTLDNIFYIKGKFWTIDTMYWTIINEKIVYPKYLYCYLSLLNLACRDSGSTLPSMTFNAYYTLDINLPKYKEQIEVGDFIFKILNNINNNKKYIEYLEKIINLIYNYWFLQFDFPDVNGKPYKLSGGKMLWNEEFKKEIPEDWEVKSLDEIVEMVSGFPFSTKDYDNNGKYKIYTIKNVQNGYINSKVDNYIDFIPGKMSDECKLKEEDIIMSLTGNVGRVGLVYEKNALLNQRVLKLKPKYDDISYIYSLFNNEYMRKTLEKNSFGTSQKNLSPIEIGKIRIIYPDKNILKRFCKINNCLISQIVNCYKENEELELLRNFLLPLLMNGQVTFRNDKDI